MHLLQAIVLALGDIRFVGGCVRDAVMERPCSDFDLATPLLPEESLTRLAAAQIQATALRLDHGVILAHSKEAKFEIATLRRDVSTDGRHAVVAFTNSWEEDAQRRDFTLNTLSADPDGNVYDPLGVGLEDACKGRVQFVGIPEDRLREDRLRALRFVRFTASHGNGIPNTDGLTACKNMITELSQLSSSRIWRELSRMLVLPSHRRALCIKILNEIHAMEVLLPVACNDAVALQHCTSEMPSVCLAAVLEPSQGTSPERLAASLAKRLTLSKAEHRLLNAALSWRDLVPTAEGVRLALLSRPVEEVAAQITLWHCKRPEHICGVKKSALFETLEANVPVFPLSGHGLAHIATGSELGALLQMLRRNWALSGYTLSARDLLKQAEPKQED